jgi:type IV pilus assembly protein PilC
MSEYSYVAKNLAGETKQGMVDARTADLAINLLKTQGLFVINIEERRESIMDQLPFFNKIPLGEVVNFTRQFSTMISAGLTISRALEVLEHQTQNRPFKKVIYDVLRSIEGGSSLSAALGRYPEVFNTTYQSLVRAGESSGKLDDILKTCRHYGSGTEFKFKICFGHDISGNRSYSNGRCLCNNDGRGNS